MRELNTERIIDNLNKNHRKNEEILYKMPIYKSLNLVYHSLRTEIDITKRT